MKPHRRHATFLATFCLALGALLPMHAQEIPKGNGYIKANVQGPDGVKEGFPVNGTLYYKGEPVAVKDARLTNYALKFVSEFLEFGSLPMGMYEVHYEAPGYVTVIRRVFLREGENRIEISVLMNKGEGTITLTPGPSLQELEARIKKLEAAQK